MDFLKRMIEKAVERQLKHDRDMRVISEVERDISTYEGKLTVYRIGNGYIACCSGSVPVYCEDHNAVAEFIVAQTTRQKMGIQSGTQMDLFDTVAKAGKVMNSASIPYSGTIGKLDGFVHIKSKPDYL